MSQARPTVFMFSGQGSQYFQMGAALYREYPRFRMWMDHCDEVLRPMIDASLCHILYNSAEKSQPFDRLLHTNPALLSIEYSLARVLMEFGVRPDLVLGYSLGEISAAMIAGVMDLETGLRFVVDYAALLEAESPPAHMLAVLESPAIADRYAGVFHECWITARNFDRHFVVSAPTAAMTLLREALLADGVVCQLLPVKYGFHTPLIDPLAQRVKQRVQQMRLAPPRFPHISCYNAARTERDSDGAHWPEHLWAMSRHPVAFATTIQTLLRSGDYRFVDVGPSGTLVTFVKYLLPTHSHSQLVEVMNQYGRDVLCFEKALHTLGMGQVSLATA